MDSFPLSKPITIKIKLFSFLIFSFLLFVSIIPKSLNASDLWAMGSNSIGQLGDGTVTISNTPVKIDSDVSQVAAGVYNSLYVKADGSLWAMGRNDEGQLGDGTTTNRSTPVQVATGVSKAVIGGIHSLFVKTDSTLWAMGNNDFGQLGDGTTTDRITPVQISTDVSRVAVGGHSLFVKTDGTLWAMGYNYYGQLGDGTRTNRYTPVQIDTGVSEVTAGVYSSLYVKTDGTLWAMGWNIYGQLGDGTTIDRSTPVQIATGVAQVAAGSDSSLFVKTDGTLWSMGRNLVGQIGDGTTTDRITPVQIDTGVSMIAAGAYHGLYVKTDGTLWAMGYNYYGQLGDGTNDNHSTPINVASEVSQVAGGADHTLFLELSEKETTAVFEDTEGNPSNLPEKLVVGQTYQITAKYTAEGGIFGLDECYLQITHPSFPLVMAYVVGTGDIYRNFNVEEYLSPISVTRENLPDQSGVVLTWNFFIKPHWPLTDDGIDFAVYVTDNNQNADGWNFAGVSLDYSPPEFGGTIITHGAQTGTVQEWTRTMGRSIGKRLGNAIVYQLDPNSGLFEFVAGGAFLSYGDGSELEKIFLLDWATESNDVFTRGFSEAAADAFLAALIRHQINNPIPYFLDKFHFIGHSRGCVVNSEIVERIVNLKSNKSAIKQYPDLGREINVTYLDPHPVLSVLEGTADKVNPGDTKQDQVQVWDSVNYCDNYYQPDNYPEGMPVNNAYNRNLDDISGLNLSHGEVHAWYFGTIDPEATNDELANMVTEMQESIPAMNLRDDNVPQEIDINLADRALWYQDDIGLLEGFAHAPHGGNNVGETRVPPSLSTTPFYNYLNDDFFNGSFIYGNNQIPGWLYQGGGGDGFIDLEHLELEAGNASRTHNWFYIPSNAETIYFKYRIVNNSAGSPPATDQLQLQIDNGLASYIISQADPIWLDKETSTYVSRSYDISQFAGTIVKIKLEIIKGGLLLDSKVYIEDVQLQFNMPTIMPWIPLLLLDE